MVLQINNSIHPNNREQICKNVQGALIIVNCRPEQTNISNKGQRLIKVALNFSQCSI